jgi:iron complex outermembrane receptor protein
MKPQRKRGRTAYWAVCWGLAGLLLSAMSIARSRVFEVSIEAGDASETLKELVFQTQTQLIFRSDDVKSRRTQAVRGEYALEDALNKLLSGSGLSYRFVNERTVAITSSAMNQLESSSLKRPDLPHSFGASLSDTPRTADVLEDPSGPGSIEGDSESTAKDRYKHQNELDEVVITGTNIRGTANDTAQVIVLDRNYIQSTGITTTAGLMESLPQNFASGSERALFVPGVTSNGAQGESINLRGIGEGTTLTLLNGHRMAPGFFGAAADISGIPLSAIERVDVLTDGASAVYGSDAVGGVVNFILRKDFEGAETSLHAGLAPGGLNEDRFSQAFGHAWGSGNALVSFEYYKRDLLPSKDRDFVPIDSLIGSLMPRDKDYSVMFSGRQGIADEVAVFADALYARRNTFNEGGLTLNNMNFTTSNPQLTATAGLTWKPAGDWQVEASGSDAENQMSQVANDDQAGTTNSHSRFTIRSAELKADGSLFKLPGGPVRAAIGLDWRTEHYQVQQVNATAAFSYALHEEQNVRSVFAELHVPIFGEANEMVGIRRLELSVAGRFDDYSTFGSSVDPQIGIIWEPIPGLKVRANHGSSFKAPNLPDYDLGQNAAQAYFGPDPGAPGGTSYLLALSGVDPNSYQAQKSTNSSFGVDFAPAFIKGLNIGLNYYRIDYRDRIAIPGKNDATFVLSNPDAFAGLITRNPSVLQVDQAIALSQLGFGFIPYDVNFKVINNFDPASVQAIVDLRSRNLSALKTSGFDVSAAYSFSTRLGELHFGVAGTHIISLLNQVTPESPAIDQVGTIYNPPSWRLRGSAGWRYQRWAANIFLNYTDSYLDNRLPISVPVSSYTTIDSRLAYEISHTTVSLSAQNLFNRDPPRIAPLTPGYDLGFDPANANPLGRVIAIDVTRKW